MYLDDLTSCAELKEVHVEEAARSSASMRAFLRWASEVARPGEGAPKVMMAVARLAHAGWVEGTPYIEIRGDESTTTLSIFSNHGIGIRERIVPLARFGVPFEEFTRAAQLAPQLVSPLCATHKADALILTPPGLKLDDPSTSNVTPISIDSRSLHAPSGDERPVTTVPPSIPEQSGVHTRPTVRRMVAVRPEAFRRGNGE